MKIKAALKNEDEYYHKMVKAKVKDGKHVAEESEDEDFDPKEFRKILKT